MEKLFIKSAGYTVRYKSIMSDLNTLLDRIRTQIYIHGDHPIEWFEDFDKLRCGRVTADRFRRVFETIRFTLTDQEFNLLVEQYSDKGMVNYKHFCDDVSDVFSNRNLEKDPHGTTMDSHKLVARTLGNEISNTDVKMLPLLKKMANQVRTRAIHVCEAFMDFDPHNNGRVTQSQFFRALPFRDLTKEDMAILVDRYADPILRDMNYRKMNTDINNILNAHEGECTDTCNHANGTRLLPHQLQSLTFNQKEYDKPSDDVNTRFAKMVREQRIRIRDFFQQHDPLNKGLIPVSKFEGTLTLFGFNFTEEDINNLVSRYKQTVNFTDYVRYREYCADIEAIANQRATSSVKTRAVTTAPTATLEHILDGIRHTVIRFRINVLPTFQNFDRQKRGFITETQFHRSLATLDIRISTDDLKVITEFYGSEEGIDYFKFIEDIDPDHKQSRRMFKPIGTDRQSIEDVYGHTPTGDRFVTTEQADEMIYRSKRGLIKKIDEKQDIDSLIYAMKQWAIINGVDFEDFLKDFDKHRIGEIPASQFRSGLSMSTYKLTENEFDTIVDAYKSETRQGFVKWYKFTQDILSAIAPLELEMSPKTTPLPPTEAYKTRSLMEEPTISLTPRVNNILEIVARHIKARRVSLVEQFKDKDKLNHKRVTATGFAQVIQLIGVHISKDQIDQLCTFYNDPNTNFVDYVRFCTDVDNKTGLIFGDTASDSQVINPIPKYGNDDSPYLVSQKKYAVANPSWEAIKQKLQTFIYKRQVRLTDFFQAFDRLHKGKVTQQKFNSVVGQTNLPLTADQIDIVAMQFMPIGEPDMFNYRDFCNELNEIFGPTEMVKDPTGAKDRKVDAMPDPSATLQNLASDEDRKLRALIQRMRNLVVTRRMNITEQFMDYDRAPRKNYITKQQFKQCIARLGLTTNPADFDVLCKKYRCTDLDDMNYMAFCSDIEGN